MTAPESPRKLTVAVIEDDRDSALLAVASLSGHYDVESVMLALTAYAGENMRDRFIGLGFDGYVAKPLRTPEQLLHAVQELLPRAG